MVYLGLSRRALRDIAEIKRYSLERWAQRVAEDYLDSIEEALNRLRESPALLRTKPEFSRYLRFYRVHRHFLVCSTIEQNIYVLAVKHGGLDLPNRLAELQPRLLEEADLLHKIFLAKVGRSQ
ncbi:MAG TPA: type II toxin-antitoxin system RelE/ParE family toxin [Verrucomicrobiae bacterium]|nr:type II toxin-antitoxin system RelE/ParE family toxin [Verrucomicrobiae bacterium]